MVKKYCKAVTQAKTLTFWEKLGAVILGSNSAVGIAAAGVADYEKELETLALTQEADDKATEAATAANIAQGSSIATVKDE